MSTITDRCVLFRPTYGEWIYYNVILLYIGLVFARILHELGHSIANVLTGGVFSLSTLTVDWFLIIPMGTMQFNAESLIVLYAGPLSAILIGWWIAYSNRYSALNGPCGGRNTWKKRRGLTTGFLLQALWDAIYLVPVVDPRPFNGYADGDGVQIASLFRDMGLHEVTVFDTTVIVNPAYVISGALLVGTFWIAWKTYKCTHEFCSSCSV